MSSLTISLPSTFSDAEKRLLWLVGFEATEGISTLSNYRLEVQAEPTATIPFDKLLGQEISISWTPDGSHTRCSHGIVAAIEQLDSTATCQSFLLEMRPWLWLYSRNKQCRIYQGKTVGQIVSDVLSGHATSCDIVLGSDHVSRIYCVQYEESDFSFLSRLLEDEGIYYFFSPDGKKLCLRDDSVAVTSTPTATDGSELPATTPYDPGGGGTSPVGRITSWRARQRIEATGTVTRDANFQESTVTLVARAPATASAVSTVPVGSGTLKFSVPANSAIESRLYPGGYSKLFDPLNPSTSAAPSGNPLRTQASVIAKLRMQATTAHSLRIKGDGTFAFFYPGYSFTLCGNAQYNDTYLTVSVSHKMRAPIHAKDGAAVPYESHFTCLPKALPYRPPLLTPKPKMLGSQTARVVGPSGMEIDTDKFGRVRVAFPWAKNDISDDTMVNLIDPKQCSCWVRVAQPWAGQNWGAMMIPRIGQEVVVGFENGDPDTPIIVGSVYNDVNPTAFDLPAASAVSGIKSRSTPGGKATEFSGLEITDTKGKELFQLRAQMDMLLEAKNNQIIAVANNQHTHVSGTQVNVVGGARWPVRFGDPPEFCYYQPDGAIAAAPPEGWEVIEILAGPSLKFNAIYGSELSINASFVQRSSSGRHDCVGATMSFLDIVNITVKGAMISDYYKVVNQGLGRLDRCDGPYSSVSEGLTLETRRGGHVEGTGNWNNKPIKALKVGWILYGMVSSSMPMYAIGVLPNQASTVGPISIIAARILGILLLTAEKVCASAQAGMVMAETAKTLAVDAFSESTTVPYVAMAKAMKAAEEAIAATRWCSFRSKKDHFSRAEGSYFVQAKELISLSTDQGIVLQNSGGAGVTIKSKTFSVNAHNSMLALGDTMTPLVWKGDFNNRLECSNFDGFVLETGASKIEMDPILGITITAPKIKLTDGTGATSLSLDPAGINKLTTMLKETVLANRTVQAPLNNATP